MPVNTRLVLVLGLCVGAVHAPAAVALQAHAGSTSQRLKGVSGWGVPAEASTAAARWSSSSPVAVDGRKDERSPAFRFRSDEKPTHRRDTPRDAVERALRGPGSMPDKAGRPRVDCAMNPHAADCS